MVQRFWVQWLICLVIATTSVRGQSQKERTVPNSRGTLNGRVFAITNGGDLKPARLADVYIMQFTADGAAVGNFYMKENVKAIEAFTQEMEANGKDWSKQQECIKDLSLFQPVILKVIDWSVANKKTAQLIIAKTDEEGRFSITLPKGTYSAVISGRAGFNESLWETKDMFTILPHRTVEIKLSSPTKSCLLIPE